MHFDEDYFGMPERNFALALRWTSEEGRPVTVETRVPSRKEVRCLPPDQLRPLLVGWMVHSPAELVPSRGQIGVVPDILAQRDDAHAMGELQALCRNYIYGA